MNPENNPNKIKEGEYAILDKNTEYSVHVKVLSLTHPPLHATIKSGCLTWQVRTKRLSKVPPTSPEAQLFKKFGIASQWKKRKTVQHG